GGVTIGGGTIRVGNGGTNGNLPPGNILNNASLVFNRSDNVSSANVISGTGSVAKSGTGILTLSGVSIFSGAVNINQGTLQAANVTALGSISGRTTISNGAT